jgi:hypothetical protein
VDFMCRGGRDQGGYVRPAEGCGSRTRERRGVCEADARSRERGFYEDGFGKEVCEGFGAGGSGALS